MFKLITFDVYSAILDINGSAIPKVCKCLDLDEKRGEEFFKLWRSQQWNYLLLNNSMKKGYKSYKYITRTVLDYTASKFNVVLSERQANELMEIWTTFNAWEEAKDVVLEIKSRGYKIAMLSNGDYDMLAPLQKSSEISFDYIFSAEDAKVYKPSPEIYKVPMEKLNINPNEMLHVAGSMFDVVGAKSAGLNCAWSNRFNDLILDDVYEPDYNMNNLRDLLDILK